MERRSLGYVMIHVSATMARTCHDGKTLHDGRTCRGDNQKNLPRWQERMSELRDEHVTMSRTRPSPANECTGGEGSMERRRPPR